MFRGPVFLVRCCTGTRSSAVVWKLPLKRTGMTCWKRHPTNCSSATAGKLTTLKTFKNFVTLWQKRLSHFLFRSLVGKENLWTRMMEKWRLGRLWKTQSKICSCPQSWKYPKIQNNQSAHCVVWVVLRNWMSFTWSKIPRLLPNPKAHCYVHKRSTQDHLEPVQYNVRPSNKFLTFISMLVTYLCLGLPSSLFPFYFG